MNDFFQILFKVRKRKLHGRERVLVRSGTCSCTLGKLFLYGRKTVLVRLGNCFCTLGKVFLYGCEDTYIYFMIYFLYVRK